MSYDRNEHRLTFEFVIDSRLARDRDEFRFRVLLDDQGGPAVRGVAAHREYGEDKDGRFNVSVTWCRPVTVPGTPARVLADSGAAHGAICAYGKTYDQNGHFPQEVRGMIVTSTAGLPKDPHPDAVPAEMVNGSGQNVFEGVCSGVQPNFVFRDGAGGAFLPKVKHSASGTLNMVVIWIKVGSLWSRSSPFSFLGGTATSRDCEAHGGGSGPPSLAMSALGGVDPDGECAKLRIVLGTPRGVLATDVLLSRDRSSEADLVWNSCSIRDPLNDWKLWVETRGGAAYATLALRKLMGTSLEAPLLWRSETWTPGETNRLQFDAPTELTGNVPSYVDVWPA